MLFVFKDLELRGISYRCLSLEPRIPECGKRVSFLRSFMLSFMLSLCLRTINKMKLLPTISRRFLSFQEVLFFVLKNNQTLKAH
jgi:hypothetical protein